MDILDLHSRGTIENKRVLLYDIENTTIQVETWSPYQSDAVAITRDYYILSIAWRWLGEKKVHVMTLADFKAFKDPKDDSELVKAFYPIFDSADIVIAHNGNKHDQRKLRTRFISLGLNPPSPMQQIDTLLIARRIFAFSSNRLDELGRFLKLGRKIDCPPSVWRDCMDGKKSAFKQMGYYNKKDVELLEKVYHKLAAWDNRHPFIGVVGHRRKRLSQIDGLVCPRCGSERLSSKGWRETAASYYRQYECIDCGGYCSSQKRQAKPTKELRSI